MSEIMEEKKLSLLGHIIRRDFEHLTYQVSFATPADATRATPLLIKKPRSKRRQGRQRLNWTLENMKNAWQTINDSEFDDISFRLVMRAVCSKCFHACESSREEMPSSSSPELQASLRGVGSPVDTACQCACSFCSCSRIWNIGLG